MACGRVAVRFVSYRYQRRRASVRLVMRAATATTEAGLELSVLQVKYCSLGRTPHFLQAERMEHPQFLLVSRPMH